MRLTSIAALIVVLTAGGVSQDCPEITEAALENDVIVKSIPEHDISTATVDVLNFHPVCLAYSQERDRYRFVSVVVQYTCTGNANCPSGTAVEQFDSQCSSGTWMHSVLGDFDNTRTKKPTANFSTTPRENCSLCVSPATATGPRLTTDPVTHCVGRYMSPFTEFCSIGVGDNLPQHVIHPAMRVLRGATGTKTANAAHTTMLAHVWTLVPVLTSVMMNITVSVHLATLATTALRVRD